MGILQKAEEVLHMKGHHHESTSSTNHGPHDSNVANKVDPRADSDRDNRARHQAMGGAAGPHSSNLANKADPRVDSDRDNRAHPTAGTVESTHAPHHNRLATTSENPGQSSTNAGPHSSNLANKLDPRVDSDVDNRARHENIASSNYTTGGTVGPHGSDAANKLDPRIDSDADNRALHGNTMGSSYNTGATGVTGATTGSHATNTSTNAGPHSSNLANKLDPRVDSDVDNRARHQGLASSNYTSGATVGPHGSDTVNKLDPRIDSDADNRALHGNTMGSNYTTGATGATGATTGSRAINTSSTNAGPHNSNLVNKLDPRVDSDADNRARHEGLAGSSYNTGATVGPHSSDMANKLDPRVDSDMDNRNAGIQRQY